MDKEDIANRGDARAAIIPSDKLTELRDFIAVHVPLEIPGRKTRLVPDHSCEEPDRQERGLTAAAPA